MWKTNENRRRSGNRSVKKLLSAIAVGALVSATIVVSTADEALAAAVPATLTLTCTDNATLVSSLADEFPTGAPYVVSALIADDIVINASGADDCVIANVTGNAALTITGSGTVEGGTPTAANELDVANSGAFTITPVTGAAVTVYVDACSLSGSGIDSDPWRVGSQADFQKVGLESNTLGAQSCSLAGYYLQTADLTGAEQLDDYLNDRVAVDVSPATVSSPFTGTYDGDHYRISLGGTNSSGWNYDSASSQRHPLFQAVSGTIKKVRVSGNIVSNGVMTAGLVGHLINGGIVSEVSSSVNIESTAWDGSGGPFIGGIVARTGAGGALIQYSKSTAVIDWNPPDNALLGNIYIGGIIGLVGPPPVSSPAGPGTSYGAAVREVRDSYSSAVITIDTTSVNHPTRQETSINVGGILGAQLVDPARFIRAYSVASASDACTANCASSSSGGTLQAGAITPTLVSQNVFAALYFLPTGLFQEAVGTSSVGVNDYTAGGFPAAVPASASTLKTMTTYQSKESAASAGDPSGLADLSSDPATDAGTFESDYRWAIEPITAQTFVPSNYSQTGDAGGTSVEIADYSNRVVYSDTTATKEYRVLRGGVLSAHGGVEAATVVNYPALGRVWDICDDYPTLVWEENNSCTGSGGSSSSSSSSSSASSKPGGLSDSEYAEFLASGLTLEQFLAARLAATGPNGALLVGGGSLTLLFLAAGAAILVALRRERRLGRL